MELEIVPIMRPRLPTADDLHPFLCRIDESRHYSNFGQLQSELVSFLAEYFRVDEDQIALVTNGTLALSAAIATSTGAHALWKLPSWTFVATAHAVASSHCRIQFLDVQPDTWMIDTDSVSEDDNVIDVWPFGDRRQTFLGRTNQVRNGYRIVDAASCFHATKDLSDIVDRRTTVMVSLHATKTLSSGEGGVLIGPKDWISEIRRWINFGFWGSRDAMITATNAKISEYQAAIGLSSAYRWADELGKWSAIQNRMNRIVKGVGWRLQPAVEKNLISSTLVLWMDNSTQKMVVEKIFKSKNIETRDWWGGGVHTTSAFKEFAREPLPNTDDLGRTTLGIPCFTDLSTDQFSRIEEALILSRRQVQ